MSHPSRRTGNRPSRRHREKRAYQLTLATGAGALASLVTLVLAIAGVTSFGLFLLFAVLTAIAGWLLKGTLGR